MLLVNQIVKEGQFIWFDVCVFGILELEVVWMKGDYLVGIGECIYVEKDGDLYSLKILEVDIEDEGIYMCQVKNIVGIVIFMVDLNVECKWIII